MLFRSDPRVPVLAHLVQHRPLTRRQCCWPCSNAIHGVRRPIEQASPSLMCAHTTLPNLGRSIPSAQSRSRSRASTMPLAPLLITSAPCCQTTSLLANSSVSRSTATRCASRTRTKTMSARAASCFRRLQGRRPHLGRWAQVRKTWSMAQVRWACPFTLE